MEQLYRIINLIGLGVDIAVAVVFFFCFFWSLKTYSLKLKVEYKHLTLYLAISSLFICGIYIYLFINGVFNDFSDVSRFGTLVIRPSILLLGGAIASLARARYLSLKRGGAEWILQKPKI